MKGHRLVGHVDILMDKIHGARDLMSGPPKEQALGGGKHTQNMVNGVNVGVKLNGAQCRMIVFLHILKYIVCYSHDVMESTR